MRFETHREMPLEKMTRVTRQQFCVRMDELMDMVTAEDTAFIIEGELGGEYALCPASWFRVSRDDDFDAIIICAVRYAIGRNTYMPSLVEGFVRRWMDFLEDKTLTVIARNVGNELLMNPDMPDAELWAKLRDDLEERMKGDTES